MFSLNVRVHVGLSSDTEITLQGDGLLTFLYKDIDVMMRVLL